MMNPLPGASSILNKGEWSLLDEQGLSAVTFTSFIDISYKNGGQTLSYPIEQGGFLSYGKTQAPLEISLTLSTQGSDPDFEQILLGLNKYREEAVKLTVSTPSAVYDSMTVNSYSYKKSRDENSGMLTVELELVEVRETGGRSLNSVISKARNPSSAAMINTGRTQAQAFVMNLK